MKQAELKALILKAQNRMADRAVSLRDAENPQARDAFLQAVAMKNVLEDVASAMSGNPTFLQLLASKAGEV